MITINDGQLADAMRGNDMLVATCKALLFRWMDHNNVSCVCYAFNGSGDSGDFESWPDVTVRGGPYDGALAERFRETPLAQLPEFQAETSLRDGEAVGEGFASMPLGTIGLALARHIENTTDHGIDWWNNDGGEGRVEFLLNCEGVDGRHYDKGVCLNVRERIITLEEHFFAVEGVREEPESVEKK